MNTCSKHQDSGSITLCIDCWNVERNKEPNRTERTVRIGAMGDCIIALAQHRDRPACVLPHAVMECVKILKALLQKEVNKR